MFSHRFLLFLAVLYLLIVVGFSVISYFTVSMDTRKELGDKAKLMAINIAEGLNMEPAEFDRLLALEFSQLLNNPVNVDFESKARGIMKHSDIKYIYLESPLKEKQIKYKVESHDAPKYGKPEGTPLNAVYVLDAVVDDETRLTDTKGKGYTDRDKYSVMSDDCRKTMESQKPAAYLNKDEWGTYITGYAPWYDSRGEFRGLVGVDLFLDKYLARMRGYLIMISGYVILLLGIGFFSSYLLVRIRRAENLVEEKSILAGIDELTSLLNRRSFLETMEKLWNDNYKKGIPLALIILDVDYFKGYNDTYGHLAGDEILRQVAGVLNSGIRSSYDYAGRYGGDEFVVLLNGADADRAGMIAANLVKSVADLRIGYKGFFAGSDYVTVTAGCASLAPKPELSSEDLFERADKALLMCKERGRNSALSWNEAIGR